MVRGVNLAAAVKSLWEGKCTVTVRENKTNEANGRTEAKEVDLCTNEPCRISFDTVQVTEPSNGAAQTKQTVTLFIDPAVSLPAGSKITVTQKGTTGVYEQSGKAAVYSAHKEIPLELFKGWV